jgi:MmyB-like transcription regulator ligand binding domain
MDTPATVRNTRGDYVGANQLGRALYAPLFESREQPANSARFLFLDPAAGEFYTDWERVADELVAHLRSDAGRNPYDRGLSDLVGELSTRSTEFRTRWATHNVRHHHTGHKNIHHPVVGDLHLTFEAMALPADPGLTLVVYSAGRLAGLYLAAASMIILLAFMISGAWLLIVGAAARGPDQAPQ